MANKKIESPEVMWSYFEEYKTWAKSHPYKVIDWVGKDGNEVERPKERPLTMDGFENHLAYKEIITDISDYYENKDARYDDYVQVCKRIKRSIRQDQIEGGMANMYNSSITARLNGLVDKQENHMTAAVQITGMEIK